MPTRSKPSAKPLCEWIVTDDSVGIVTGARYLEVIAAPSGDVRWRFMFPVERTHYTGRHSVKGQRLARRLAAALNAVEKHRAENEARTSDNGRPIAES